MISETGNNSGFTLIEVMLTVSILALGLIGVLGAYKALLNAMQIGQYSIEVSCALKEKMSETEKESIEKLGVSPKYEQGLFGENYPDFSWEEEIETTGLCKYEEGAAPTNCLDKVKITVTNQRIRPVRRFSLVTYMENYEQEGGK